MRENDMRWILFLLTWGFTLTLSAAEMESRAQTHYVPQDLLQTIVRKEGWTEITLKPYNGVRKGDVVRVWAGGVIDRGGGDAPGINVCGPTGGAVHRHGGRRREVVALAPIPSTPFRSCSRPRTKSPTPAKRPANPCKSRSRRTAPACGSASTTKKGAFMDNHLGKGRRHELDPAWVRIEVIRIIVD